MIDPVTNFLVNLIIWLALSVAAALIFMLLISVVLVTMKVYQNYTDQRDKNANHRNR